MDLLWVRLVSLHVFLKTRITCVKSLSTGALESLVSWGMLSTKNNLPASGLLLFRTKTHNSDWTVFPLLVVQCVSWSWGHTHRWGPELKGGVVTVYVSSLSGDSWSIKWSCCRVIWTTSVSLITRRRLEPGTSFGGWSGTGSMCTITTCNTRTTLQTPESNIKCGLLLIFYFLLGAELTQLYLLQCHHQVNILMCQTVEYWILPTIDLWGAVGSSQS